jgi:hypothetical protein
MRSLGLILALLSVLLTPIRTEAQSNLLADYEDTVGKLRIIGGALRAYAANHPANTWPARLTDLATQGYLDASNLICRADYSHGTEGCKPDGIFELGSQYPELDESNCSFYYEFSGAMCSWYFPGYVLGPVDDPPTWGAVKKSQLLYGDVLHPLPYDPRLFPAVRCFWFGVNNTNVFRAQTMLNLGADRTSVFASDLFSPGVDESADGTPELRDVLKIYYDVNYGVRRPPGSMKAEVEQLLLFPLWPKFIDVSNLTYRLAEPAGTGQSQILGTIDANIFQWTPDHFTPSNALIKVELLRDGLCITNKTYSISVSGTDGDGMPNDWELEHFETLERDGVHDFDSDGYPDLSEYIAGTSPTDDTAYLSIRSISFAQNPAATVLRWPSVQGRTYHVLKAASLAGGWTTNALSIPGNGGEITLTNQTPSSQEFYRLQVGLPAE